MQDKESAAESAGIRRFRSVAAGIAVAFVGAFVGWIIFRIAVIATPSDIAGAVQGMMFLGAVPVGAIVGAVGAIVGAIIGELRRQDGIEGR